MFWSTLVYVKAPNCYKCRHLRIYPNAPFPYRCEIYEHDFSILPSTAIKRLTGNHCESFEPKDVQQEAAEAASSRQTPRNLCLDCERSCDHSGQAVFYCPKYRQRKVDLTV